MTSSFNNRIVIVTGLPRSGTSMMMKMLEAGGLPPLCDGERLADSDNPNGYYEYEPVKQTKTDSSWLAAAPGRAVKMVYSLLYDLPQFPPVDAVQEYDVIFMRRDLQEILASQRRMLRNMNIDVTVDDDRMARLFSTEIHRFQQWLQSADHIRSLEIHYNDVAGGSVDPLHQISSHLDHGLDVSAMSAVVDPSLYRNRVA